MKFVWDPAKREENLRKHGIDFKLALRIFDGPVFEQTDNRFDYGEQRMLAVGSVAGIELTVIYTDRAGFRRLISARKATSHERAVFYNACLNSD